MIGFKKHGDSITFPVRVVPRASKSEVVGEHEGALRVRIAAPPVDGAANDELIRTLAGAFQVGKRDVEITGGLASKRKMVRISGVDPTTFDRFNSSKWR